jgi:hypothetical protein
MGEEKGLPLGLVSCKQLAKMREARACYDPNSGIGNIVAFLLVVAKAVARAAVASASDRSSVGCSGRCTSHW